MQRRGRDSSCDSPTPQRYNTFPVPQGGVADLLTPILVAMGVCPAQAPSLPGSLPMTHFSSQLSLSRLLPKVILIPAETRSIKIIEVLQDTEDRANLAMGLHKLTRRQMEIH